MVTVGPWAYWLVLNGASKPGGQSDTALLPLVDMLNHDTHQEVHVKRFALPPETGHW